VPHRRVVFSLDADPDLDNILDYTERTWGHQQAAEYALSITESLNWLASLPDAGRIRDSISPGLRSLALAHHVALYRLFDDRVTVRRIIHHREDIRTAISDSDWDEVAQDGEN
jgi:toxin ParE1/3/4